MKKLKELATKQICRLKPRKGKEPSWVNGLKSLNQNPKNRERRGEEGGRGDHFKFWCVIYNNKGFLLKIKKGFLLIVYLI